jgi:mRNA-degrading endonuclease RelE of RelBE toxin-antitoxin system
MSYRLEFKTSALKEWRKLDSGLVVIVVVAIGKREQGWVYRTAKDRV